MNNKNTFGHLSATITILIWGSTFVSTKILLEKSTPLEILFLRFLIGFIALCIIYPKPLKIKDRKQEIIFAGAGLCGVTLYYLLENIALTYTLVSNVGVIVSMAPFFVAVLTYFFVKDSEKPKKNFFIGFAVAITGICLISFNQNSEISFNPFGDFLAVTASFVWAIYSLLVKKIGEYGYNVIQTTKRTFFYGLIFMIVSLLFFDFDLKAENFKDFTYVFNVCFLGFGASAICFVTWNQAVNLIGAVKTSAYIYAVPVLTIINSVLILHEKITLQVAVGAGLTLLGLFISQMNSFIKVRKRTEIKFS